MEQRFSNLAQGLLTLGTMTGPLLIVLHLIPQGVLAGLFFVMGVQALEGNGITLKILFLLKDSSLTPSSDPLKRIQRRSAIWIFVAIQLVGFGATFAITQTIAAVGFPIFILLLVPVRTWLLPRRFEESELRLLDAPTASPFTMISVGGNYGEEEGDESGEATAVQSGLQSGMGSDGEGVLVGGSKFPFCFILAILVVLWWVPSWAWDDCANDCLLEDADADSDEGKAERGEGGSKLGMKRRESWRGEGRSGRWDESGDGFEMQDRRPGVSRRSVSRQSK